MPFVRADAWATSQTGSRWERITVRDGRYGPYVNWAKVNATLPRGKDPASVTFDEAVAMIAEKAARGGSGKSFRGKGRKKA